MSDPPPSQPRYKWRPALRKPWATRVEEFRHSLAYIDALPQLTLLGLASGIAAAVIIVFFRLLVDGSLSLFLANSPDNFESLSATWRFALPAFGAAAIGVALHFLKSHTRNVSVSHVLDRLHNYQGVLPLRNCLVQFFAGAVALISGQSVGREGPAVHLGAGAASLLGQWLKLPNNSLRTLVGCGVAAAIAASFNTPMAGVIFAMEVILMEYTITGFIPVILASVSGAVITQLVFSDHKLFAISAVEMASLLELPFMVFGGLVVALAAAAFTKAHLLCFRLQHWPIIVRLLLAGLVTGSVAVYVPQILGMGYDTINSAILGQVSLEVLLIVVILKMFITGFSVGLGMPGGLIGPMLVIGACVGGILGHTGNTLYPEHASNAGFYVVLGMAAMMGAVINAPLAALIAILELTYNPNIIFPSMVMIVVACFTTQQVFRCQGIFVEQLKLAGRPIHAEPAQQLLSRVGVRSVMSTAFVISASQISINAAHQMLEKKPQWIIFDDGEQNKLVLKAVDLANYLESLAEQEPQDDSAIKLKHIPGQRYQAFPIRQQANLFEAGDLMKHNNSDVVLVEKPTPSPTIVGVITRDMINNYYGT